MSNRLLESSARRWGGNIHDKRSRIQHDQQSSTLRGGSERFGISICTGRSWSTRAWTRTALLWQAQHLVGTNLAAWHWKCSDRAMRDRATRRCHSYMSARESGKTAHRRGYRKCRRLSRTANRTCLGLKEKRKFRN